MLHRAAGACAVGQKFSPRQRIFASDAAAFWEVSTMGNYYRQGTASPCLSCIQVSDPRNCENKNCRRWRAWFLDRWALIHAYQRRDMDTAPLRSVGVPLGGRHYCHPEHTRQYLAADPCQSCRCPRDLCTSPCRIRRAWEEARGDVLL